MARFSRNRTSRTVVSAVVIAITIGAAYQFHRIRKSEAKNTLPPPPLGMSVMQTGEPITLIKPAVHTPVPTPAIATPPAVTTLVTQTPDLNKPSPLLQSSQNAVGAMPASAILPPQKPAISGAPTSSVAPAPTALSGDVLNDAKAKFAAGDLIGARTLFNQALLSQSLSAADTDAVKKQMAEINQNVDLLRTKVPQRSARRQLHRPAQRAARQHW